MKDAKKLGERTVIILCVDRDDDIGQKVGVETPIIGREQNLEVAVKLALKDPEEADANAIFEAVRLYDELSTSSKGERYEVVTIAGSSSGGIFADRAVAERLSEVLSKIEADGAILVTDGYDDEVVIPIIQSRIPILSIRRIVIRHSRSIEETWAVFWRYVKKVWEDPLYSKWFLGVPGLLLLIVGVFWALGLLTYVAIALVLVLGLVFAVRGFGIDERVRAFVESIALPGPTGPIVLLANIVGVIVLLVGLYVGGLYTYNYVVTNIKGPPFWDNPSFWMGVLPTIVGVFLSRYTVDLAVVAASIALIGWMVHYFFTKNPRFWGAIVVFAAVIWLRYVAYDVSAVLLAPSPAYAPIESLIATVYTGLVLFITLILVVYVLYRKTTSYFTGKGEVAKR